MNSRLLSFLLAAAAMLDSSLSATPDDYLSRDQAAAASSLKVSNNHPFAIRATIRFALPADLASETGNLLAVSHSVAGGTVEAHYLPVQLLPAAEGDPVPAWIDVQLRPNESRTYTFQDIGGGGPKPGAEATIQNFPSGLPRTVEWPSGTKTELFDLALVEILQGMGTLADNKLERLHDALETAAELSFELREETHGPVTTTLLYRGGDDHHELDLRYDLFSSGAADVEITLRAIEPHAERGYLAIAKRFPASEEAEATVGSRGEVLPVTPGELTPDGGAAGANEPGRDVNWLALAGLEEGENRALLADFSPNLTRRQGDRYLPANGPFVNEVVIRDAGSCVMLAEIARAGAGPADFALPAPDEPVRLRYRLLPSRSRPLVDVEQAFTAFAGYQGRHAEEDQFHVSFGVGGVRFGTSYHVDLSLGGETPGGESFSAGKRQALQEQIRRDFRIANALGLDYIRIHGFNTKDSRKDYLATEEGSSLADSLAQVAETARETGMSLYLDLSLSPGDSRLVAEKFGDVISFYGIERAPISEDVSIDQVEQWRRVRDAIKSADSDATVVVSGEPQSLSLQHRLTQLGLGTDALAQQIEVDAGQSAAFLDDLAVSLGGYATRHGTMPLISGYSVRLDARDAEITQANRFFTVFDRFLAQRNVPVFLQFPLIDPVADGASGLLRLDRTPKIQAQAYHELVKRYGETSGRLKTVGVSVPALSIRAGERRALPVKITNNGTRPLEIQAKLLLPEGLTAEETDTSFSLRPRQSHTLERSIEAAKDLAPGYYHIFEELRYDQTVRLGWSYLSHRSAPQLDLETAPAEGVLYDSGLVALDAVNLSNVRHVIFGGDAPDSEIALAWKLQDTLRTATGADVRAWPHDQAGEPQTSRSLVVVGNQESNPFLAEIADFLPVDPLRLPAGQGVVMVFPHPTEDLRFVLVVSGSDSAGVEKAAADLLQRF